MRILLVEDEPRVANFVVKGLRENAFAVDVAETGENALYQAEINTYDAIILDVMIPEKDGFEVCRALREKGSQIPILMLTARDAVEDRISGFDFGADDYLTKPFAFGELLARLRAILRRREKSLLPTRIAVTDLDAQLLRRLFSNIIVNALKHAESFVKITAELCDNSYDERRSTRSDRVGFHHAFRVAHVRLYCGVRRLFGRSRAFVKSKNMEIPSRKMRLKLNSRKEKSASSFLNQCARSGI